MFLLLSIIVGVLIGLIRGGKLSNILDIQFRGWPVLLSALIIQLVIFSDAGPIGEWALEYGVYAYVLSLLLVIGGIALNFRQYAFPVILLGAVMNFLAIASNGGHMPAPEAALLAARGPEELNAISTMAYFSNSGVMTADTHFAILGDIFVLPPPFPLANVFSIGDVLIGLGVLLFVQAALVSSSASRSAVPSREGNTL